MSVSIFHGATINNIFLNFDIWFVTSRADSHQTPRLKKHATNSQPRSCHGDHLELFLSSAATLQTSGVATRRRCVPPRSLAGVCDGGESAGCVYGVGMSVRRLV